MNCADYHEDVSRYVDRELDEGRIALLFEHLAGCTGCRGFLASMMELRSALRRLPAPAVPARLDRRVHGIRPAREKRMPLLLDPMHAWWDRRLLIPVPALAGMALLLLSAVLVSFSLWQSARRMPAPELQVMYIMSIPTVEVEGFAPAQPPPIQ